jgi:hypothetical protein
LHLAAKQLIAERKLLYLPKLQARVAKLGVNGRTVERSMLLRSAELAILSDVRLEERLGSIRPDLIVDTQGLEVLVEIAYTSFVTPAKLKQLELIGKPAIEFDVSNLTHLGFKELEALLFGPSESAKWVWHPDVAAATQELTRWVDEEIAQDWSTWEMATQGTGHFEPTDGQDRRLGKPPIRKSSATQIELRARQESFRLSSADAKIQFAVDSMGEEGGRVRELLPLRVSGGHRIGASAMAWQVSAFAKFVHKALKRSMPTITADEVSAWIKSCFEVPDDKTLRVAVWHFLKGLEGHGVLHRKTRQEFIVLVPDLIGALAIARDRQSGECRPLKWVDPESAWPSRDKSRAVASAFAAAFGCASSWERMAGLLPGVCRLETPEETVQHYSNSGARAMMSAHVRRFLVSSGFVAHG